MDNDENDYIHEVYLEISNVEKNVASMFEKINDNIIIYKYNTSIRTIIINLVNLINLFKKFIENNENIIDNIKALYLEKDNLFDNIIDKLNKAYEYDIIPILEKYFNTNEIEYKNTLNMKYIEILSITQVFNNFYDKLLNNFISNIDIDINIDDDMDDDMDEE
jgi:hypothetical protein